MSQKFPQAYRIYPRLINAAEDHREYDGVLEKFSGYEQAQQAFFDTCPASFDTEECIVERTKQENGLFEVTAFSLPKQTNWKFELRNIQDTDFPMINPRWPIMSCTMLDTLLSICPFSHQAIPINLNTVNQDKNTRQGWFKTTPEKLSKEFFIVHLLEHIDRIDWDRSVHTKRASSSTRDIKVLVLKETEKDLPPIFRLVERRTYLYVSAEARNALEEAGIQGIEYQA